MQPRRRTSLKTPPACWARWRAAPFAERGELAAFAGLPPSSTPWSRSWGLSPVGLVDLVRHTRTNTSRVRRWYLSPLGIERPGGTSGHHNRETAT